MRHRCGPHAPVMDRSRTLAATALLGVAALVPFAVQAQSVLPPEPPARDPPGPAVFVVGGTGSFEIHFAEAGRDAHISGDAGIVGLGFDLPLASWISLEPSLTRFSISREAAERYGGGSTLRWQLDFGLRGEIEVAGVHPYLSAGFGGFFHVDEDRPADRDFVTATYGVGAGMRVPLSADVELRAEAAYRRLDDAGSRSIPLTLRAGWRF